MEGNGGGRLVRVLELVEASLKPGDRVFEGLCSGPSGTIGIFAWIVLRVLLAGAADGLHAIALLWRMVSTHT
jgi:hypothetical protein